MATSPEQAGGEMTDIPIIFSTPMVRALLAGYKTMTRRLAWRACKLCGSPGTCKGPCQPSPWQRVKIGDRLWVRENFSRYDHRDGCWYWADGREARWDAERPRPSIHMPRWASRLTLIMTGTKVQPLQSICHNDILAEGIFQWDGVSTHGQPLWHFLPKATKSEDVHLGCTSAFNAWRHLWTCVNGEDSWEENPDVVALSFRAILANIDSLEAA
jgi:hypothetical protein